MRHGQTEASAEVLPVIDTRLAGRDPLARAAVIAGSIAALVGGLITWRAATRPSPEEAAAAEVCKTYRSRGAYKVSEALDRYEGLGLDREAVVAAMEEECVQTWTDLVRTYDYDGRAGPSPRPLAVATREPAVQATSEPSTGGPVYGQVRSAATLPPWVYATQTNARGQIISFNYDLIAHFGRPVSLAAAKLALLLTFDGQARYAATSNVGRCYGVAVEAVTPAPVAVTFFSNSFDDDPEAFDTTRVSSAVVSFGKVVTNAGQC